jgi:FAD/FMN-containing dehydrogenase
MLYFINISGGCICGAGLETSSHKYGMFADTCVAYELVLSDGRLITCSKVLRLIFAAELFISNTY